MAAEWRFEDQREKTGAARVCVRAYEALDELIAEVQLGEWDLSNSLQVLDELRIRLESSLPFDPEYT